MRSGFLRVGAQKLEWSEWGTADARATIVLLHEGLGSVGLWFDFPERLAARTGLRVFAYSRTGYGRSSAIALPRPLDYMTREAQDVLPGVLDFIGSSRVVLFGHSDGATIAAIHAGTVPDDRIAGLVLVAPHFFTEEIGLRAIVTVRDAYERGGLRDKLARWHANVDCAFFGWNLAWSDPAFGEWNVEAVLNGIRVPVCVVQGETDAYGSLAQVRAVERRVQASVEAHVLPGIGHSPHREATNALLDIVSRFVEARDAP